MDPFSIIILAAGKGTRMKSSKCKVLHPVAGSPMIIRALNTALAASPEKLILVVGHQADQVKELTAHLPIEYALQTEQLGTGHAVASAGDLLDDFQGPCLILCGDTPLIETESIESIISHHVSSSSDLSVVTTYLENPTGYGRILRNHAQELRGIVEERDATPEERKIREINTGVYAVETRTLFSLLESLDNNNIQREYYLTDIVRIASDKGLRLNTFAIQDSAQVQGVNTMVELAAASKIIWDRKRSELMSYGVCLMDPASVFVDSRVTIGHDTTIYPGVTVIGDTSIGANCVLESGVFISDCAIGDNVHVKLSSRLDGASVGDWTSVGPMAHLRPGTIIGKSAKIGNFVEVKKTDFGDGSKASHLTYLGDSAIGEGVNIGCGVITCNYDGRKKHKTVIGSGSFVGSDVQFVAPVNIGEGALIAAGSTITKDVPAHSLGVSRAKQKTYPLRQSQRPESWKNDKGEK